MLDKFVNQKGKYLRRTMWIFLLSLILFLFMDKELMPKVDQGQFTVKIDMPAGMRLETTDAVSGRVEKFLLKVPDVESVSVTVGSTKEHTSRSIVDRLGSNQAEIVVTLKKKRKLKSADVVQMVKNSFNKANMDGARMEYSLQENVLSAGLSAQAPVTIELKGNDLAELERLMREVQEGISGIKSIYGVKNDLSEPSPEVKVYIDKDKASLYGMSVMDIAQTSLIGLKGYVPTKFKEKGEEFDVRVRLRYRDRNDFNKLSRLEIQSATGARVQLGSVAKFGYG
jgi:HAE1 family hydrophobic/amphiphilic exporter-1